MMKDLVLQTMVNETHRRAIAAHKAGRTEEAYKLYSNILKLNPNHPEANYNLGILSVGLGRTEQALSFFKTSIEAKPNAVTFWLFYIQTLVETGRLMKAKSVLKQARDMGVTGKAFDELKIRISKAQNIVIKAKNEPTFLDDFKLEQAIKFAEKKHKEGLVEDARQIYGKILKKFPNNKKVKNRLKKLSTPRPGKIVRDKEPPRGQLQQLIELHVGGQYQKVVDHSDELLNLFPESPTLHNIRGAAYAELKQYDTAIKSYKLSLKHESNSVDAFFNMGIAQKASGYLPAAIQSFFRALKINPNYISALFILGDIFQEQGDMDAAVESYSKILKIYPEDADAHFELGNVLNKNGKLKAAIECYKKVIKIKPDYVLAYFNMGVSLQDIGDLDNALKIYRQVIKIKPGYADAQNSLGLILKIKGDFKEAIKSYKQAIENRPSFYVAHNNLGVTLQALGDFKTAMCCYETALKLKPDYVEAINNVGLLQKQIGDVDGAEASYKQAINIKPEYAGANFNLGLLLLKRQKFEQGFQLNEWRWKTDEPIGKYIESSKPLWNGEHSQAILTWREQGLGDQIAMSSLIPELYAVSSTLSVECDERLIPLFKHSFPHDIVYESNRGIIAEDSYDFHVPMQSLYKHFRTTVASFGKTSRGWLACNRIETERLRATILNDGQKTLVGISWGTNNKSLGGVRATVSLHSLAKALHSPKVKLVSLQYGDHSKEIADVKNQLGIDIIQLASIDNTKNVFGLAALMSACDRVCSIDNATIHLAGALGLNSILLASYDCDWRWGLSGSKSILYDTVKILRQPKMGAWETLFHTLKHDRTILDL